MHARFLESFVEFCSNVEIELYTVIYVLNTQAKIPLGNGTIKIAYYYYYYHYYYYVMTLKRNNSEMHIQ